jgi:predicted PurR-regulated permease PerM
MVTPLQRQRSMTLLVIAVLASILVLQYAQAMVIPIVVAILVSYALEPMVARMTRVRVPRPLAAAIVLAVALGAGATLLYQLRFEATEAVRKLPQAAQRFRRTLEREKPPATSAIQEMQKAATELGKVAEAAVTTPPPPAGVARVQVAPAPMNVSQYLLWGSIGLAAGIGQLVLVTFLAYFLMASGDLYRRKFVKIAGPSLTQKRVTVQILEQINRQIESFLLVQLLTSALVGVASWLVFRWIGLEQAGIWGLLAGVFNSIPYFGPVLVTGAAAIVAFVQFGRLEEVVLVAGAAFAITTLEGFLLMPWLTSRTARMNAVAVFVGLIFWGWVWEVWGLLLAVPMLVVVKAICDHVEDFRNVGELLGE